MDSLKILILFHIILAITCQNSSDCVAMYKNKSTDQRCLNQTDCCYYDYDYNGKTYKKCLLKLNITENICKNFSQIVTVLGGTWGNCNCYCVFFKVFIPNILVLLLLLI